MTEKRDGGLLRRTASLADDARPNEPTPVDGARLLSSWGATRVERDAVWFYIAGCVTAALLGVGASAWLATWAWREWFAPPRSVAISDSRWASDYRERRADRTPTGANLAETSAAAEKSERAGSSRDDYFTGMQFLDRSHVAVISRDGIHHGRVDAGSLPFWSAVPWHSWYASDESALPEDDWRDLHFDRARAWFVSHRGGLVSCDKTFRDWRRHIGAAGFEPYCNLEDEMQTVRVVDGFGGRPKPFVVVGTKRFGAGLYDTATRDWLRLGDDPTDSPAAHITCLLWQSGRLWVGSRGGVRLYRVVDSAGAMTWSACDQFQLPAEFTGQTAHVLRWAGDHADGDLHVVIGNNAHLSAKVRLRERYEEFGEWRTRVDGGEPRLADFEQSASRLNHIAVTEDGVWLALPGRGIAFYDSARRRLELRDQGLSAVDARCEPLSIHVTQRQDEPPRIWAVVRPHDGASAGLFEWFPGEADRTPTWTPVSDVRDEVVEVAFHGHRPIVRLNKGKVVTYQVPSRPNLVVAPNRSWFGRSTPTTSPPRDDPPRPTRERELFADNPCRPPFGPSAGSSDRLFVAGRPVPSTSTVVAAAYDKSLRGWIGLTSNNTVMFDEFGYRRDRLYGSKVNGEFGWFDDDVAAPTPYRPLYGPSDMPPGGGRILTVDWGVLRGDPDSVAFCRQVRDSKSRLVVDTYAYQRSDRSIRRLSESLTDVVPWKVRQSGRGLYLWGQAPSGAGIVKVLEASRWKDVDFSGASIVEFANSPSDVVVRARDGTLFAHGASGRPQRLAGTSAAPRKWDRLIPDDAGHLWGIARGTSHVYCYHRRTATWASVSLEGEIVRDLLFVPKAKMALVGTSLGVREFEIRDGSPVPRKSASATETTTSSPRIAGDVRRLWQSGRHLYALITSQNHHEVWRGDDSADGWTKLIGASLNGPPLEAWQAVVWADFIESELWMVTSTAQLWRYYLGEQRWSVMSIGSATFAEPRSDRLPGGERVLRRVMLSADRRDLWCLEGAGRLWRVARDETNPELQPAPLRSQAFDGVPHFRLDDEREWMGHYRQTADLLWRAPFYGIGALISLLACWWVYRAIVALFGGAEPPAWRDLRRWLIVMAVLGATGFAGAMVCEVLAARQSARLRVLRPFERLDLAHKIDDFHLANGVLRIRSSGGVYDFDWHDAQAAPRRHASAVPPFPPSPDSWNAADGAGVFQIRVQAQRLTLLRQGGDESRAAPCHPCSGGLSEDAWLDMAVHRDRLILLTRSGVLEYSLDERPRHLTSTDLPSAPDSRLWPARDQIVLLPGDGRALTRMDSHDWRLAAQWAPTRRQHHGVVWFENHRDASATLEDFDETTGRFASDTFRRLLVSHQEIFAESEPGWRRVSRTAGGYALDEPVTLDQLRLAGALADDSQERPVADFWVCARESSSTDPDRVRLSFGAPLARQEIPDPFAFGGRWPDEDVRCLLVSDGGVFLGTRFGIKMYDHKLRHARMGLAGQDISALAIRNGDVFCRSGDDTYQYVGDAWRTAPGDSFPEAAPRRWELSLGDDRAIAVSRSVGDGHTTELLDYDATTGRFVRDDVRQIVSEDRGFWCVTPTDVQRVELNGGVISRSRRMTHPPRLRDLRHGGDGRLFARSDDGDAVYVESRDQWENVADGSAASPYVAAVTGSVSDILQWRRHFSEQGDHWELWSGRTHLAIRGGKLTCDEILDVAATPSQCWQKTPAGFSEAQGRTWIDWPDDVRDRSRARVASTENGQLACHENSDGRDRFFVADSLLRWHDSHASQEAFLGRRAVFDRRSWSVVTVCDDDQLTFTPEVPGGLRLNQHGKFDFDQVYSVVVVDGQVCESCPDGLASRPATGGNATFQPWPAGVTDVRLAMSSKGRLVGAGADGRLLGIDLTRDDATSAVRFLDPSEARPLSLYSPEDWRQYLDRRQLLDALLPDADSSRESPGAPARHIVEVCPDVDCHWILTDTGLHRAR